jgi:hypothetical protein
MHALKKEVAQISGNPTHCTTAVTGLVRQPRKTHRQKQH